MLGSERSIESLSAERWQEIARLLDAALELSADERSVFLQHHCADTALRHEVERLLQSCEKARHFLAVSAPAFAAPLLVDPGPGASADGSGSTARSTAAAKLRERLQAVLGSAYVVERELASGGISRAYVALEAALGRRVVVKVLPPEMVAGLVAERFHREIRLAAQLSHPRILPFLTSGEGHGVLYYTMPWIEGEWLRARLTRWGSLSLVEAVRLLRDLADVLLYAHDQGVAHGDLKPETILLEEGRPLVTECGVAGALSAAAKPGGTLALVGLVPGTPAYMAPERAAGEPTTDLRADIYSLGVVAYELLTGAPPFTGQTARIVMIKQLSEAPEPVSTRRPDVPSALNTLIMRCLARRPADRPRTAEELVRTLEKVEAAGTAL